MTYCNNDEYHYILLIYIKVYYVIVESQLKIYIQTDEIV